MKYIKSKLLTVSFGKCIRAIFNKCSLFIYFGCPGSLLLHRLSVVAGSRGSSLVDVSQSTGLGRAGFDRCGLWAQWL